MGELHSNQEANFKDNLVNTELDEYCKKFYRYYVSNDESNNQIWRCTILDFSACTRELVCDYHASDNSGNTKPYRANGKLEGQRLILIVSNSGTVPPIIEVYPSHQHHIQLDSGLSIRMTFGGEQIIAPCFLSPDPVNGWTEIGPVNQETAKELNRRWANNIGHDLIYPAKGMTLGNGFKK